MYASEEVGGERSEKRGCETFREKSTLARPRLSTRILTSFPTLSGQIGDVDSMHRRTQPVNLREGGTAYTYAGGCYHARDELTCVPLLLR
jgi:hypothetical protein